MGGMGRLFILLVSLIKKLDLFSPQVYRFPRLRSALKAQNLPQLSAQQAQKLRLLSLLTLAAQPASTPSNLHYASLTSALGLATARELEAIVTDAIYRGLVTGTLDPAREIVSISSVAPLRDLAPGSVPTLRTTLDAWSGRCETVIKNLESEIARVKAQARRRKAEETRFEKRVESANKELDRRTKKVLGQGSDDERDKDAMDVDEEATTTKALAKGAAKRKEKV